MKELTVRAIVTRNDPEAIAFVERALVACGCKIPRKNENGDLVNVLGEIAADKRQTFCDDVFPGNLPPECYIGRIHNVLFA